MHPCRQHQERKAGHSVPNRNPLLDRPCWSTRGADMDTEAAVVVDKTGDNNCSEHCSGNMEAIAEPGDAVTMPAAGEGTGVCWRDSIEAMHKNLRKIDI